MIKNTSRIVIIGSSCSGKTSLAKILAAKLRVTHIELDAIHWKADWVSRECEEFRELTSKAIAEEKWVADGNYSVVRDLVWGRASTIIWLNYFFPLILWRALSRTSKRVFYKEEMYSSNRESFKRAFLSTESILLWVLKSNFGKNSKRKRYPGYFKKPEFSHLEVRVLKNQKEADALVLSINDNVEP